MYKCNNCGYEDDKYNHQGHCFVCGDFVTESSANFDADLNGDGKFDDKDVSIAAKVMAKASKKKSKKR